MGTGLQLYKLGTGGTTTMTTEAVITVMAAEAVVVVVVVEVEAVAGEVGTGEVERVHLHQKEVVEGVPGETPLLRSLMSIWMVVR
jgi:hypothetical protein